MQFLGFGASSERHVNWAEEILSSMDAHQSQNYLLDDEQQRLLGKEIQELRRVVNGLKSTVEERDRKLVERLRVLRAHQRVADFICDSTVLEVDSGLRPHRKQVGVYLPGGFNNLYRGATLSRVLKAGTAATVDFLRDAAEVLEGLPQDKFHFANKFAARLNRASEQLDALNKDYEEVAATRLSYSTRLQRGEVELREALQQMNGRLRSYFTQGFIESLYPRLYVRNTRRQEKDEATELDSDFEAEG